MSTRMQALVLRSLLCVAPVAGHGFMRSPASRNIPNGPKNGYCQHCGNGNANVCGDGNQWPADSDYWKYTGGQVTVVSGDKIKIEIVITAHHRGHFEFSICDHQIADGAATANQDCLNKHLLHRVPPNVSYGTSCLPNDGRGDCQPLDDLHKERWYLPPPGATVHQMYYYLPENLACSGKCTLQWRWFTANSCAPKPDYKCHFDKMEAEGWHSKQWCGSTCGTCTREPSSPNTYERGCGEEFANCADIEISAGGTNPATTLEPSQPTPAPTPPTPPSPSAPVPVPPGNGCTAIPGMNAGATDENCAKCATGYRWWPCNSSPKLCACDPTDRPVPTPPPISPPEPMPESESESESEPMPEACGSCTGCIFFGNGVCYTDIGKSYCDAFAGKALWCGTSLVETRAATSVSAAASLVAVNRHFLASTGSVLLQSNSATQTLEDWSSEEVVVSPGLGDSESSVRSEL